MSDIPITNIQASNNQAQHELAVLRVVQENEPRESRPSSLSQRDIARRKGMDISDVVNDLLKANLDLVNRVQ